MVSKIPQQMLPPGLEEWATNKVVLVADLSAKCLIRLAVTKLNACLLSPEAASLVTGSRALLLPDLDLNACQEECLLAANRSSNARRIDLST